MNTILHNPIRTIIKEAYVDKGVVPVVNWLNSYNDVFTQYACEGYTEEEKKNGIGHNNPYVIFFCFYEPDMTDILSTIFPYQDITCEIEYGSKTQHYNSYHGIRYILRFKDKKDLKFFIDVELKPKNDLPVNYKVM